jgi:hypothetical protein
MANFASITSEFSAPSALTFGFTINCTNTTRGINKDLTWTCVTLRSLAFEYTQGADAGDQGAKALAAVQADISNDAQLSPYLVVDLDVDSFRITANEYGWTITEVSNPIQTALTLTETPEVLPTKDFQIISDTVEQAQTNPVCSHVEVNLTANADGVGPFVWTIPSVSSSTLGQVTTAEIARQATNQNLNITITDDESDAADPYQVLIPRLFTTAEIQSISIVANAGGFDASVTVFMGDIITFPNITYSLDGSVFQSSNVFPNVVDGNYTLYINDGFGCVITQAFVVDTAASIARDNPNATVPKSNSLRFVQLLTNEFNTYENTLYRNFSRVGEYRPFYAQPYQNSDGNILTQFRTNYDSISARLLDCNDAIVDTLTVTKKSDNLGARDKRDAFAFNLGNNQTGIFFTQGNIYDPSDDSIISTYDLSGQLPEWGVVGNTVILTGNLTGTYVIKQVKYDATVQATVLVIDLVYTPSEDTVSIFTDCTYNRLPYEVYEFPIDMSALSEGIYYAQILLEDSVDEFVDVIFNSEYFSVSSEHKRTNVIEYSVSDNAGIDYTTGIINKIRVRSVDPYQQMTPEGEVTNYVDSIGETVQLKDIPRMAGTMFFEQLPKFMVEKIRLIMSHETILINGEQWTNEEGIEVDNFIRSAIANVTVKLSRNNYEEYKTDNIDVDGDKNVILTETGNLLQ